MLKIGDIVVTKFKKYENANKAFGVKTPFLSPYMVISEISKGKIEVDPENGHFKTGSDGIRVKCIWFSRISGAFEERWFLNDWVEKISEEIPEPIKATTVLPLVVSLRYAKVSSIQKVSLTIFEPPVMQVIKIENAETSKNRFRYNAETQQKEEVYWLPKLIAKCLWFNSVSQKFEEVVLPLEVLVQVEKTLIDIQ